MLLKALAIREIDPRCFNQGVKMAKSTNILTLGFALYRRIMRIRRLKRFRYSVVEFYKRRKVRMIALGRIPANDLIEHFPAATADTEDCILMPFEQMAQHLQKTTYTIPAGNSRILKEISYCAKNNMLLSSSRRLIAESSSAERKSVWFQWKDLFELEFEHLDGFYTSLRSFRNNYYHSLVDELPRLFLLHHPAYADREIKLLLPGGPTPVESYFLDKLCPPNVKLFPTKHNRIYTFDEFLFTDFLTRRFAGYLPHQYLEFFHQRVLPDRERRHDKKILISRKKAPNSRNIVNEEELAEALLPLGYQSYVLEDLDLDAQIELFYDASAVVAPHGAGLTNLIYAQNANVLELHPNRDLFPHYYYLCKSLQHPYQYWYGDAETRFSPFRVDVPAIMKLLT